MVSLKFRDNSAELPLSLAIGSCTREVSIRIETHFLLPTFIASSLHAGEPPLVLLLLFALALAASARAALELGTAALPLVVPSGARPCARYGARYPATPMKPFHARTCRCA